MHQSLKLMRVVVLSGGLVNSTAISIVRSLIDFLNHLSSWSDLSVKNFSMVSVHLHRSKYKAVMNDYDWSAGGVQQPIKIEHIKLNDRIKRINATKSNSN